MRGSEADARILPASAIVLCFVPAYSTVLLHLMLHCELALHSKLDWFRYSGSDPSGTGTVFTLYTPAASQVLRRAGLEGRSDAGGC